jgi:hypothetical protein
VSSTPTPAEARAIAQRFVDAAFNNPGTDRPRFSIPARPDYDDDIRLLSFIEWAEGLQTALDASSAEVARLETVRDCASKAAVHVHREIDRVREEAQKEVADAKAEVSRYKTLSDERREALAWTREELARVRSRVRVLFDNRDLVRESIDRLRMDEGYLAVHFQRLAAICERGRPRDSVIMQRAASREHANMAYHRDRWLALESAVDAWGAMFE